VQNDSNLRAAMSQRHSKGLLIIGSFKLLKAILFLSLGIGALHFINADLSETVHRIVQANNFDSDSRFVATVLDKVDEIDDHRLRIVSMGSFAYAGVAVVEGVGLLMELTWASYLTLILSISFLPWELYEIARDPALWRFLVLATNLAIVAYLLWFLKMEERARARRAEARSRG
jgi:uncharacterized membrane protein (DUF2068 family)